MTETMLSQQKCVPHPEGDPALSDAEIQEYGKQIPDWKIIEREGVRRLERTFKFPNFVAALAFTNRVGQIAEEEDHHPAILIEWGKATVAWWTHSVKGLHRNDFIMAAKTDELYR